MAIDFKTCLKLPSGNIRSPRCRLSYPRLFEAVPDDYGKLFFTCSFLIYPDCDISLLKSEGVAAVKEKFGDKVSGVKSPYLDAVEKGNEGLVPAGTVLIRTKSKQKPGILNARGENVDDEAEVYPGRWCFVTLSPYAWVNDKGGKGLSFGMRNIQLLEHDTPLAGGRVAAESEFEAVSVSEGTAPAAGGTGSASDLFA